MTTDAQIQSAAATMCEAWSQDWAATLGPLSTNGLLLLCGIVKGENDFGNSSGFVGSNNWGSLRCYRQDYGCIQHGDLDQNGKPLVAGFQKFPTPLEGARGFLHTLLTHKTPVPVNEGTAQDVAAAMYANGYYTGVHGSANAQANIADYATMIQNNANAVQKVLGVSSGLLGNSAGNSAAALVKSVTGGGAGSLLLGAGVVAGITLAASHFGLIHLPRVLTKLLPGMS